MNKAICFQNDVERIPLPAGWSQHVSINGGHFLHGSTHSIEQVLTFTESQIMRRLERLFPDPSVYAGMMVIPDIEKPIRPMGLEIVDPELLRRSGEAMKLRYKCARAHFPESRIGAYLDGLSWRDELHTHQKDDLKVASRIHFARMGVFENVDTLCQVCYSRYHFDEKPWWHYKGNIRQSYHYMESMCMAIGAELTKSVLLSWEVFGGDEEFREETGFELQAMPGIREQITEAETAGHHGQGFDEMLIWSPGLVLHGQNVSDLVGELTGLPIPKPTTADPSGEADPAPATV